VEMEELQPIRENQNGRNNDPGGYWWPSTYFVGSKNSFHFGNFFIVFLGPKLPRLF
jgi:hypothetical protein